MTALLFIDTKTNRVRRYAERRPGGRLYVTDEVQIIRPQCDTLGQQLDALLLGRPLEYALPQDHIPAGAA